jgi:hypothetical protein
MSNCRKAENLSFSHSRLPLIKPEIRVYINEYDVFPDIKNLNFDVQNEGMFSELLIKVDTISCKQKENQTIGIMNQYNEIQTIISET